MKYPGPKRYCMGVDGKEAAELDDSEIIALFFERSERAVDELGREYGRTARRLAANILGDGRDAEECVNDAYMALWNAIPPAQPVSRGGYFCRTVRNIAAKRYRANAAQKRDSHYDAALDELAEVVAAPAGVEDALNARELTAAIDRFLDGLDYIDRYLFMRRYWYGDDLAALAGETGIAPRRISVRLFRLREKLKKQLEKEGVIP